MCVYMCHRIMINCQPAVVEVTIYTLIRRNKYRRKRFINKLIKKNSALHKNIAAALFLCVPLHRRPKRPVPKLDKTGRQETTSAHFVPKHWRAK